MVGPGPILLFVSDEPVLSSLQFSLAIEGFDTIDGAAQRIDPCAATALLIDETYQGDGWATLSGLRSMGYTAPAFLLASHPSARLRSRATAAGAELIEKPLFGDELGRAIRTAQLTRKAA